MSGVDSLAVGGRQRWRFARPGAGPLLALALSLSVSAPLAAAEPSAAFRAKAPQAGALAATAARSGKVRVIVRLRDSTATSQTATASASADAARVRGAETAIGSFKGRFFGRDAAARTASAANGFRQMRFQPMVAFDATAAELERLASDRDVVSIVEDERSAPTLTQSVPLIGMQAVWDNGGRGSDTVVAILDTGVDLTHPFFTGGRIVGQACFSSNNDSNDVNESTSFCPSGLESEVGGTSGDNCPYPTHDACLHGTHVAGIAAGFRSSGTPAAGVAPSAAIYAVQVFSLFPNDGNAVLSWTSDQILALEHLYDERAAMPGGRRLAAINMSLGGGQYPNPCTGDSRRSVIQLLEAAGIATVISSGNSSYKFSTGAPGCVPEAVTVGSSDKSDAISSFSNMAAFVDLMAPGTDIVSSVPGGGFVSLNGTSMAAPHVTGAIAAMMSAAPTATLAEIVQSLKDTGVPVADTRTGGISTQPRIEVDEALAELIPMTDGTVAISPTAAVVLERRGSAVTPSTFTVAVRSTFGTIGWRLTGVPSWLSASKTSGSVTAGTPVNVVFTTRPPASQAGNLVASLAFAETGGAVTARLPVTLRFIAPTLSVSPSKAITIARPGKGAPKPSKVTLTLRTNHGTARWTLAGLPSWLKASATSGSAGTGGTTVTLTVTAPKRQTKALKATLVARQVGGGSTSIPITLQPPKAKGKNSWPAAWVSAGTPVNFLPVDAAP